jgi:hypothetical protein
VHVFRADGFTIGAVECKQDFPEARLRGTDQRTGMEYRFEIGLGES